MARHRKAGNTLRSRVKKKRLEKTSWFKNKKKKEDLGKFKKEFKKGEGFQKGEHSEGRGGENNIKSVIYVQHTIERKLARKMREEEEMLERLTGYTYRLKVVERAGDSLESLLHRSNPWSGTDCARSKCLRCETKISHGNYENQKCSKRRVRNLV